MTAPVSFQATSEVLRLQPTPSEAIGAATGVQRSAPEKGAAHPLYI